MMMRRNTIAFLLAMLVCMAGMLWVAPHLFSSVQAQDMQRLVLRDSSGRELFSRPAPDGSAFAIRYRHSVALSPVEDWFSVSGGCIYLEKRSIRISGPACRISRARDSGCIRKTEKLSSAGIIWPCLPLTCAWDVWRTTPCCCLKRAGDKRRSP